MLRARSPDSSIRVSVGDRCIEHWFRHRQRRFWQREAGGLLFAPTVGSSDGEVMIETVTGPHSTDSRTRYSLQLDHGRCLADINEQFERGMNFVGYWHTHPEAYPRLSSIDRRAFMKNLAAGGIDLARMLAVVVGKGDDYSTVHISLLTRRDEVELAIG